MKKLFSFALSLLLVFCSIEVQTEEITETPAPKIMSKDTINYLLSEDIYQGTLSWQGNKVSPKFNYDKPMKK